MARSSRCCFASAYSSALVRAVAPRTASAPIISRSASPNGSVLPSGDAQSQSRRPGSSTGDASAPDGRSALSATSGAPSNPSAAREQVRSSFGAELGRPLGERARRAGRHSERGVGGRPPGPSSAFFRPAVRSVPRGFRQRSHHRRARTRPCLTDGSRFAGRGRGRIRPPTGRVGGPQAAGPQPPACCWRRDSRERREDTNGQHGDHADDTAGVAEGLQDVLVAAAQVVPERTEGGAPMATDLTT